MVECIVFHSARPGVGKSTIAANVAALMAARGQRVGLVDANLQDGGLALFFGLEEARVGDTLNDFLLDRCDGAAALYDVTPPQCRPGSVMLLPASPRPRDLGALLQAGFRIERMTDDLPALAERLGLDRLLVDTHAGLQEQTLLPMLSLAIAHTLVVVLQLDQRDYQGTGVTVDVAHTLKVPRVALVASQVAAAFAPADVARELEGAFKDRVLASIPYAEEVAAMGCADLFVLRHPDHPVTRLFEQLADELSRRPHQVAA